MGREGVEVCILEKVIEGGLSRRSMTLIIEYGRRGEKG